MTTSIFLRFSALASSAPLVAAIASVGCSSASEPSPSPQSSVVDLDALKASIANDDCHKAGRSAGKCPQTEEPFIVGDVRIDDASTETVMLIDELPALPIDVIRYQHRIAGYYRWTPDGKLNASPISIDAPVNLRRLLEQLQTTAFVPAEKYETLVPDLMKAYGNISLLIHGAITFDTLVEHLPHHALVLVDAPFGGGACDDVRSPEGRERARALEADRAQQLRDVMAKHNVRYLNFSGGHDLPQMKDNWSAAKCTGPVPTDDDFRAYLETLRPVYDVMFASPGVIATQAASYADLPASDAPYDRIDPSFRNRVRVGSLGVQSSSLDASGVGPSYAFDKVIPSIGGADVYVNTGVHDLRGTELAPMPLLMADVFGTAVSPAVPGGSTSWAAPLALLYAVTLRESRHAGEPFDDALVASLIRELTPTECPSLPNGRCIFQDPLRNGQVEDLRLGYRPRVFVLPK